MKIVVDIKNDLKKDDIIIYDGEQFVAINKEEFLFKLKEENKQLKEEFKKLQNEVDIFKKGVNDKLKDYHNILQKLTKEE